MDGDGEGGRKGQEGAGKGWGSGSRGEIVILGMQTFKSFTTALAVAPPVDPWQCGILGIPGAISSRRHAIRTAVLHA